MAQGPMIKIDKDGERIGGFFKERGHRLDYQPEIYGVFPFYCGQGGDKYFGSSDNRGRSVRIYDK